MAVYVYVYVYVYVKCKVSRPYLKFFSQLKPVGDASAARASLWYLITALLWPVLWPPWLIWLSLVVLTPAALWGEQDIVFLYIIARKCCCGFPLQLTFTARFYFDVSAFETPLHLEQPGGVSVKIHPLVSVLLPQQERFTAEGRFVFEGWAHLMEMWSRYVFIMVFLIFQCIQQTVATGKFC